MLRFVKIMFLFFLPVFVIADEINNLTLSEAVDLAIENNRDIGILREKLNKQEMIYYQAISRWAPSINFSADYSKRPSIATGGLGNPYIAGVSVEQMVFSSEIYHNLIDKKLAFQEFEEQLFSSINDLIYGVRQAYYGVILNEERVEVCNKKIKLLEEALDFEEQKLNLGETTLLQVQHSKVSVSNASTAYQTALRDLKRARYDLIKLLGLDCSSEPELSLEEKTIEVLKISELSDKINAYKSGKDIFEIGEREFWDNVAFKTLPNIKKQEIALKRARKTIYRRQAKYFPTVSVFADYSGYGKDGFLGLKYGWGCGLRFSWDIFDGLSREFKIQESKYSLLAEQGSYYKMLEDVKIDVSNSIFDIKKSVLSYVTAAEGLKNAEDMVEQAEHHLELGNITPLEYREIVNTYIQACHDLNVSSYYLLQAYYGLRHVVGIDNGE